MAAGLWISLERRQHIKVSRQAPKQGPKLTCPMWEKRVAKDSGSRPRASYITPQGARELREELQYLWKVKRPEVTQSVREAAAQGDRSENAEYIYGKKQLREIDRRVRYLSRRLEQVNIVDRLPEDRGRVFFGAWVTLEGESDDGTPETRRYRLVGPDEFDLNRGFLSINAPMARALMGKRVDDEVVVRAPEGTREWIIVAIDYEAI